ncbi:MAG: hypothetical protein K1X57_06905 [Gemmataceae bacterium]|nr:hypothetical protein [Gemmataceae bacterium]
MQKTPLPPIKTFGDTACWQNPIGMLAYRLSLGALVPPLGIILGPCAFVCGIVALRRYRANRKVGGFGQSRVAMTLGVATFLSHLVGVLCIAYGQGWIG